MKSTIASVYDTLTGNTATEIKFCEACADHIQAEHVAFVQCNALLHALRMFDYERTLRVVVIGVRAYLAELPTPTALSLLGEVVVRTLRQGFYKPKTRDGLKYFDQPLNEIISTFFRKYCARHFDAARTTPSTVSQMIKNNAFVTLRSIMETKQDHNFMNHIFIACLLNGAHIPDMRVDILKYLLADPYQCMHILLSNRVLDYDVSIYTTLQIKTWTALVNHGKNGHGYFTTYPLLLDALTRQSESTSATSAATSAAGKKTDPYRQFVTCLRSACIARTAKRSQEAYTRNVCKLMSASFGLTPGLFEYTCSITGVNPNHATSQLQALYTKLMNVVHDHETFESSVNIPWTIAQSNAFASLDTFNAWTAVLRSIYSKEPRTIVLDHAVSDKTTHVARIFQSWHVFAEPDYVYTQVMRHVYSLVHAHVDTKMDPSDIDMYSSLEYLFSSDATEPALAIIPTHVTKTRLVHIHKTTFSAPPETNLVVLVTILLMCIMSEYVEMPDTGTRSTSLALVEVGTTPRNTQVIHAPLTFASLAAVRTHVLGGSLHATVAVAIATAVERIVSAALLQLFVGLLGLTRVGIPRANLVAYLDELRTIVRAQAASTERLDPATKGADAADGPIDSEPVEGPRVRDYVLKYLI